MGSDYWDYNFFDYGDYNFFDYGDYDDSKSGGIGGLGLDYSYDADWWMNNFLDDVDYHKPAVTESQKKWLNSLFVVVNFFQIIFSFFCLILNLYFMLAIGFKSELRKWQYFAVAIQSFMDFYSAGLLGTFTGFLDVLYFHDFYGTALTYHYEGTFYDNLRDFTFFRWAGLTMKSTIHMVMHYLNQYSTGICILYMACERYILVSHPVHAKTLLSDRNRKIHAVIISAIIISTNAAAFYFEYIAEVEDFYSFYPSNIYGKIADQVIFFFIPAIIACCLYVNIGMKLRNSLSNRERNKSLTIAFGVTCIFWVLFWSIEFTFEITDSMTYIFLSEDNKFQKLGQYPIWVVFQIVRYEFRMLYSLINPIIFIFVCRPFQEPILNIIKRLKK